MTFFLCPVPKTFPQKGAEAPDAWEGWVLFTDGSRISSKRL